MGSVSGCGGIYRSRLSHRTVPHPKTTYIHQWSIHFRLMRYGREGQTCGMDGSEKVAGADAGEAPPGLPGLHHSCANDRDEVVPPASKPSRTTSSLPALEAVPPGRTASPVGRLVAPAPETVVAGTSIRTSG